MSYEEMRRDFCSCPPCVDRLELRLLLEQSFFQEQNESLSRGEPGRPQYWDQVYRARRKNIEYVSKPCASPPMTWKQRETLKEFERRGEESTRLAKQEADRRWSKFCEAWISLADVYKPPKNRPAPDPNDDMAIRYSLLEF